MVADDLAQSAQVIGRHFLGALRFDRDLEIVHDEVDLRATGEPPVGEPCVWRPVGDMGAQLVVDPVLEGLSEQLRAAADRRPPGQMVHDPDVGEVELGRPDDTPLGALRVGGKPAVSSPGWGSLRALGNMHSCSS